jgi:hypothetical protein
MEGLLMSANSDPREQSPAGPADSTMISGAWEKSADGREWKRDFGLNYHKKA